MKRAKPLDATEQAVLDQLIADLGPLGPPGSDDDYLLRSYTYKHRLLAVRLREVGRALRRLLG